VGGDKTLERRFFPQRKDEVWLLRNIPQGVEVFRALIHLNTATASPSEREALLLQAANQNGEMS